MKRTILVVDDDDDTRKVIAQSLELVGGWKVIDAYCGAQGLECAKANQPDAILLDVLLPAMDGISILHKLKSARATAHIPVVLLTGVCPGSGNEALKSLPVEAVLSKPFDPMRLPAQIAQSLGWRR